MKLRVNLVFAICWVAAVFFGPASVLPAVMKPPKNRIRIR